MQQCAWDKAPQEWKVEKGAAAGLFKFAAGGQYLEQNKVSFPQSHIAFEIWKDTFKIPHSITWYEPKVTGGGKLVDRRNGVGLSRILSEGCHTLTLALSFWVP